jgi:hypothetical protein
MERYVEETPSAATVERVTRAIGTPVSWVRAHGGYAPTERWVVGLTDGSSVFVKLGASEYTYGALRTEANLLPAFSHTDLAPNFYGFEDGDPPMLWIEDLSHAAWPPPWTPERIEAVLDTLRRLHAMPAPPDARPAERLRPALDHWLDVEKDPANFLQLRLATEEWFDRAVPILHAASDAARLEGTDTLHLDVRSDNICFVDGRAVLVDWNFVSVGNAEFDLAAWLGSLHAEGGPLPEEILPGAGQLAAFLCGYFAFTAGQPPLPEAPRLRQGQLMQLRAILPWAARELGLPPPDLMDGATR